MEPIRFVFGVHVHQPVGNFDHVVEQHVRDVYLPFLSALVEHEFFPVALHVSGPLLEWLEQHDTRYLDLIGQLVSEHKVELLLSGFYEPILVAIPRRDRVEQIGWMREALARRFGADPKALWLTERVWQPELAADLAEAGVVCVLLDDRHFLATGFEREALHAPYRTESDGKSVVVFPIDERLRYLVPFQPPEATATYLRGLRERGSRLAVLADDGEKFGGWPGTQEWVYDRGWLRSFLTAMRDLVERGEIVLATPCQAVRQLESAGLAYLPTVSYREMEEWSLPPTAAARLARLERELGEERMRGEEGALVRGGHWPNFLVKYPEANRMHKKMLRLSALCHERGDPADARRDIGRAQCNDAYWHGVFGGLYLPHLRGAVWRHLARAEVRLRRGETLQAEVLDLDLDGHDEIWVHSDRFSAVLSPRSGAVMEEYTLFAHEMNYADVLTRRVEAYHHVGGGQDTPPPPEGSAQSIHAIEKGLSLAELPPQDFGSRGLFVDWALGGHVTEDAFARAQERPAAGWRSTGFDHDIVVADDTVTVRLTPRGDDRLVSKEYAFHGSGRVEVRYAWRPDSFPAGAWFATELSLVRDVPVSGDFERPAWRYPVATVAKSERGLEETVQGSALVARWAIARGAGALTVDPTAP